MLTGAQNTHLVTSGKVGCPEILVLQPQPKGTFLAADEASLSPAQGDLRAWQTPPKAHGDSSCADSGQWWTLLTPGEYSTMEIAKSALNCAPGVLNVGHVKFRLKTLSLGLCFSFFKTGTLLSPLSPMSPPYRLL